MNRNEQRMFAQVIILLLILLSFVAGMFVESAWGHETEIWHDANKYLMDGAGGQSPCGMGYILAHQANGRWQPYLIAGHWHVTTWDMPTASCDAFFDRMNEEAGL
jgi:hypothetical protein